MKTVVLVGSMYTYVGPEPEVWGCVRAIKHRGNPLGRLYFMDDMRNFTSGEWARQHLSEIGKTKLNDIPVVTSTAYPEFKTARGYDRKAALDFFGFSYYTCTVCYMLADAIREGYEKIIVHRFHENDWGTDYVVQKAAMDFWCGYALGKGIVIELSAESSLCVPYFWMLEEYGYAPDGWTQEDYDTQDQASAILINAIKDIGELTGHNIRPRPKKLRPLFEERFKNG